MTTDIRVTEETYCDGEAVVPFNVVTVVVEGVYYTCKLGVHATSAQVANFFEEFATIIRDKGAGHVGETVEIPQ